MEGLIEVCVGGSFQPVILDNGRFSVREATAICRQLGLGSGMLFNGMEVQCIYIYRVVLYECHIYIHGMMECLVTLTYLSLVKLSAGIPLNSLTLFGTELEVDAHAGKVRCDEQVESLSECSLSIINSFGEIRAGVRCIQTQSTGMHTYGSFLGYYQNNSLFLCRKL